jgi:DNA-binding CsgD family transcriptional regulator
MDALYDLWPDEDRRDDALIRVGVAVYGGERTGVTPAEVRVLQAVSVGLGYDGAADVLGVGVETVKTHLLHARRKLQAKNTTHAVAEALRQHLIT